MANAQPNIVVIITDDMRDSDWRALPKTQNLIADRGTRFPNFFLTTPVCSPSRASILTGRYAHNHGVLANTGSKGGFAAFSKQKLGNQTITATLKDAGYRTGLFGKFINGAPEEGVIPGGWDDWLVTTTLDYYRPSFNDHGTARHDNDPDAYVTDVLIDRALQFLGDVRPDDPFLMFFTPKAPHGPSTPARRDRRAFSGARVERSPDFAERDVASKPAAVRAERIPNPGGLDVLEQRRLASLVAVDDAVERLIGAVENQGRLENTYFFVLSDNGYSLGNHRQVGKGSPYRSAAQVMMAARGPRFRVGTTDERVVANIDLAPTIAEVARVSIPKADGMSLLREVTRQAVLLEELREGSRFRAVRTADLLYVENPHDERELYRYPSDPYEMDNLLADWSGFSPTPEAETIGADLHAELERLKSCSGEQCR